MHTTTIQQASSRAHTKYAPGYTRGGGWITSALQFQDLAPKMRLKCATLEL